MKNVAILYGGFSSEFEISKKSAEVIYKHAPSGFSFFLVEVTENGWTVKKENESALVNLDNLTFTWKGERISIDIAHVYIHGNPGENGKIQAFLDMKNIPYINSSALSSELSFDKWFCNQFLKGLGFSVAKSILLTENKLDARVAVETLKLPLFVKPTDSGSSYGISKVKKENELENAVNLAFKEGNTVVLESFLAGREFTCAVYQDKNGIHALPITEIICASEFFDFEAKYSGETKEITPAELDAQLTLKIQNISKKVYQTLQLNSIARVDFMLCDEEPFIIEVNTTPGFTEASLVPQMLEVAGIEIQTFWKNIYTYALNL
ncbi:MAG: D-alanine--D-alanine ligase [Lishizhenia sp.]